MHIVLPVHSNLAGTLCRSEVVCNYQVLGEANSFAVSLKENRLCICSIPMTVNDSPASCSNEHRAALSLEKRAGSPGLPHPRGQP